MILEKDGLTVAEVSIRTGRTHQIRAGMAAAGHPLAGDGLYGGNREKISRPALHCSYLSFLQPFSKEEKEISLDLPADMKRLLE